MQVTPTYFRNVATARVPRKYFSFGLQNEYVATLLPQLREDEMEWKVSSSVVFLVQVGVWGSHRSEGEFGSRDHFPSAASNAPLSDLLHSTICPRNSIGPQLSKKFLHPNASLALSEVSRLPRDLITRPETSIGHAQYHLVFPKLCCTSQSSCRLEGPG
jgi:hypothetical protein